MRKIGLLILASLTVVSFQNCDGRKIEFSQRSNLSESGNGGNYDGKPDPGTYYRVVPDLRCGDKAALFGQIEVRSDAIHSRVLDPKDCSTVETRLEFSEIEFNPANRSILGSGTGIFEKKSQAPNPADRNQLISEAWCRTVPTAERSESLDVLVQTNIDQGLSQVIVFASRDGALGSSRTLTRAADQQRLRYQTKSQDFEFDLDLNLAQTGETNSLTPAKLKALIGTRVLEESLVCRTGGRLDPAAPQKPLTCPIGYSRVPALASYAESDFCVAKYEAKQEGGVALSRAEGRPWTSPLLSQASMACQSNGLAYDLISNEEWQAMARNIEGVASNWGGGFVGSSQGLNRGHSDNVPKALLAASPDDNVACFGLPQSCDLSTWNLYRRTHQLSNGEVVWDLGGNVWERTKTLFTTPLGPEMWVSQITDPLTKSLLGPAGDYLNLNTDPWGGFGKADLSTAAGTIVRGSHLESYGSGGIFRSTLGYEANYSDASVGFRCVYHP